MPIRVTNGQSITAAPPKLGAKVLTVPQIKQEQTQWCWAACADMVLHYYGNAGVRQCDFANWLFAQSACCNVPSSSLCNKPCAIGDVCRVYNQWGIQCSYTGSSVAFATLQSEVNADRPVEVGYAWNGGNGHVAVIRGWDVNATGPFLAVNDPAYGSGGVYYSGLLTAYGLGTWRWTWTGLRR